MSNKTVEVRLDEETLARLDALSAVLVLPPGAKRRRANALRATLHVGLKACEADPSLIAAAKKKSGARGP